MSILRKKYSAEALVEGILQGNRVLLGRAITIVESKLQSDREIAREIIGKCMPYSGNSIRVGITGVPGAGKSTFIESMGNYLIDKKNKKVAVLAVDPSSQMSQGSILGDKTRMSSLSVNDSAYVRPSPTAGFLGGVAATTTESIILLEAAGFDVILIETVGVGQSEIEVSEMVDFFLLLVITGAGDELQGIKRGIMEMADAIVVNKSDGENIQASKLAARELVSALRLFPKKPSGWITKVGRASFLEGKNMNVIWKFIEEYIQQVKSSNFFQEHRKQQYLNWFKRTNTRLILENIYSNEKFLQKEKQLRNQILQAKISPFAASEQLIEEMKLLFSQ